MVKETKAERSRIATKAWETRKKKEKQADYERRGKKASEETRKPSEYNYIRRLVKLLNIDKSCIFHHEGIPDLMVITNEGNLRFYEIKPKKGRLDRKMLNQRQVETIKRLLKHERVEEVDLVRYEKRKGKIIYDAPIKLTMSNIKQYSQLYLSLKGRAVFSSRDKHRLGSQVSKRN